MNLRIIYSTIVLFCALTTGTSLWAQAKGKVTYDDHILPLFREKCLGCHNQDEAKGGLSLSSYAAMMEGGSSGKILEPGDAEGSRLFLLVTHKEKPIMPPRSEKLPEASLKLIESWLVGGALENKSSKAKIKKSGLKLASGPIETGKPSGPPAMPLGISLQPKSVPDRPHAVIAMAASPWAPVVAVGGSGQIFLYHSNNYQLLGVIDFPEGVPQVLKFSRNGKLLLAGGGKGASQGKVIVWDLESGDRVLEVGEEFDSVLAADISPDLTRIALGGPSKIVRIYDTATGTVEAEIRKHTEWIRAIEFSPDGVLLATGDRNGGLFIWEALTAREYLNLKGHRASITDVSWRLDSNILASSSEDASVKLWEMENGRAVRSFNAHSGGTASVEFYRDGRITTSGRDRRVKVFDSNGRQQVQFDPFGDLALQSSFSFDGTRVLGGDWSGQLKAWEIKKPKAFQLISLNPPKIEDRLKILRAEFTEKDKKAKSTAQRVQALTQEVQRLKQELAAAKKLVDSLTPKVTQAEKKVKELREQSKKARQSYVTVSETIDQKTTEESSKPEELEKLKEQLEEALKQSSQLSQQLIDTEKARRADANQLKKATETLKGGEPKLKEITPQLQARQKELKDQTALLEPLVKKVKRWELALELEKIHLRTKTEFASKEEIILEIEEAEDEASDVQGDIEDVEDDLKKLQRELDRIKKKIAKKKSAQAEKDTQLKALKAKIKELGKVIHN